MSYVVMYIFFCTLPRSTLFLSLQKHLRIKTQIGKLAGEINNNFATLILTLNAIQIPVNKGRQNENEYTISEHNSTHTCNIINRARTIQKKTKYNNRRTLSAYALDDCAGHLQIPLPTETGLCCQDKHCPTRGGEHLGRSP